MKERKQHIRVGLIAFLLTTVLLVAVLCGVRIDCVAGHALHGTVATEVHRTEYRANTSWLPPSVNTLIRVLQAERDVIAAFVDKISE